MFFRKIFGLFLILLVLGGLFGLSGQNRYQDAWQQGYIAGQQAVAGQDGTTATAPPAAPYGPYGYYPARLGFFGFLFKGLGLFFLFWLMVGFLGLLFGRRFWRHGGKKWAKWHRHAPESGRPRWHDDDLGDEQVMKV